MSFATASGGRYGGFGSESLGYGADVGGSRGGGGGGGGDRDYGRSEYGHRADGEFFVQHTSMREQVKKTARTAKVKRWISKAAKGSRSGSFAWADAILVCFGRRRQASGKSIWIEHIHPGGRK